MDFLTEAAAAVGAQQVLTGAALAPWAQDATGLYRSTPKALLRPGSTAEVSRLMALAQAAGQEIVPVSGHTGLVGGAVAGAGAVLLSLGRMDSIRRISTDERLAEVGAGVILAQLHEAVADQGLAFPVTFGARGSARIGGILSTNAGGSNVLRWGNARDLCLGIEAVLPDGRVLDLMSGLHKDNSGFNLRHLMIGAEGQLGIITAANLRLVPAPKVRVTAMVAMASLPAALTLLNRLKDESGGAVEAFEYLPRRYIDAHLALFAEAREPFEAAHAVNIMVELASAATRDAAPGQDGAPHLAALAEDVLAQAMEEGLVHDAVIAMSELQRREMWARREQAAEVILGHSPMVDCDVAVPLSRVPAFLAEAERAVEAADPGARTIFVSHLGDGNVHFTAYPTRDDPALSARLREVVDSTAIGMGGSFSAEHGIGLTKLAAMTAHKNKVAVEMMRAIKAAIDPAGILNPGKTLP